MTGPLAGYRVLEVGGIGPGPFAAMLLSDLGAEVIRIDRTTDVPEQQPTSANDDVLLRGRRSIALDLKHPDAKTAFLDMVGHADALIEGFRPGVMERLGLGPDVCLERNPKLIFGRMTGWGQDGPLAPIVGHDINYIALAGALAHFRRGDGPPVPPLNIVGDFAGGGMFLALGIVSAWVETAKSGVGQVIDAAIVDGTAVLMSMLWGFRHAGIFDDQAAGRHLMDGSHFYNVYRCADGLDITIGSLEPRFYKDLLRLTGLDEDPDFLEHQHDADAWPALSERLAAVFASKTRAEWCALMEESEVCFAPVLTMTEAAEHPHNVARGIFVNVEGVTQPAPAPRFSRTAVEVAGPPPHPGEHTAQALIDWGVDAALVDKLLDQGAASACSVGPPQDK